MLLDMLQVYTHTSPLLVMLPLPLPHLLLLLHLLFSFLLLLLPLPLLLPLLLLLPLPLPLRPAVHRVLSKVSDGVVAHCPVGRQVRGLACLHEAGTEPAGQAGRGTWVLLVLQALRLLGPA